MERNKARQLNEYVPSALCMGHLDSEDAAASDCCAGRSSLEGAAVCVEGTKALLPPCLTGQPPPLSTGCGRLLGVLVSTDGLDDPDPMVLYAGADR